MSQETEVTKAQEKARAKTDEEIEQIVAKNEELRTKLQTADSRIAELEHENGVAVEAANGVALKLHDCDNELQETKKIAKGLADEVERMVLQIERTDQELAQSRAEMEAFRNRVTEAGLTAIRDFLEQVKT